MAKTYKIAVLPGDGIGPEVMKESLKTLEAAGKLHGVSFSFTEKPVGGAAIDLTGSPLPEDTLRVSISVREDGARLVTWED